MELWIILDYLQSVVEWMRLLYGENYGATGQDYRNCKITEIAKKNYEETAPWPENDFWHTQTFTAIQTVVEKWLSEYSTTDMQILNAGSGRTEYETQGELFHLDIVERYISQFEKHLVGSIEKIALPDSSMDGVICVGSVINYTDTQRAIAELSRVLKAGGFLILEYERSDSAEFLWTAKHSKYVFLNLISTMAKHIYYGCIVRSICFKCSSTTNSSFETRKGCTVCPLSYTEWEYLKNEQSAMRNMITYSSLFPVLLHTIKSY